MIEAVIFDMDGVMIDSEPVWHEAERIVFETVGIRLTKQDCLGTQGLRVDEVVDLWYRQYPWASPSKQDIADSIVQTVISGVQAGGVPMAGLDEAIAFFRNLGLKIALASSSSYALIDAVVDKFGVRPQFDLIYSAQEEALGKPHPGVYITTAVRLATAPDRCLAIEDSINGILAAKAAKMQCIAIPEAAARYDRRYGVADVVLDQLTQVGPSLWEALQANKVRDRRS